jgi:hypothetical protein
LIILIMLGEQYKLLCWTTRYYIQENRILLFNIIHNVFVDLPVCIFTSEVTDTVC